MRHIMLWLRDIACLLLGHCLDPDCGFVYCPCCYRWSEDGGKTWEKRQR